MPSLRQVNLLDEIHTGVFKNSTEELRYDIVLDSYLCHDLIQNHYPKIKIYWNLYSETMEQMKQNRHLLLEHLSSIKNIPIIKSYKEIRIEKIVDLLFCMIEKREKEFDFKIIKLANNKNAIYFKDETEDYDSFADIIFENEDYDTCLTISNQLKEQVQKILVDNELIENYKNSKREWQEKLQSFKRIIKILSHKTNLRNERKWFTNKCSLVKPQL